MTIESATYVSELNASYPAGSDAKSEGDDHIRLIKSVLKSSFPTGSYTPTLTNSINVTTSSVGANDFRYFRIVDYVQVYGFLSITPTAGSTYTQCDITLPIASNLAVGDDCLGVCTYYDGQAGRVVADTTSDKASICFTSDGTSAQTLHVAFLYKVG